MVGIAFARCSSTPRSRRPWHAHKPFAREPGDLLVALGGMGNNRGAVVAGLLLGLFQQAANFLVGGIFASVTVFAVFIIVLLARPEGLAGVTLPRRV